jgi:diketogulonate reductase-like aldo/keto reductase
MRRRDLLCALAAVPGAAARPVRSEPAPLTRAFPKSGEAIPAVGLGTWLTFHVDLRNAAAMAQRRAVLERFFASGGRLIDSSPMYSNAEEVLGELLPAVLPGERARRLFCATKVWTPLDAYGPVQMRRSLGLWKLARADLMQVHNLLNWRAHLKTLRAWKDEGRVRLIGATTSHGNKHDEMRTLLAREAAQFDAMQITCNPVDRRAEPLMKMAADAGLAVIVNRPFDGGAVLERLARVPLPPLAAELGCTSWAELVLKWQLADPAVTCVIPATTRADHAAQNLAALSGRLPDRRERDALSALLERTLGA